MYSPDITKHEQGAPYESHRRPRELTPLLKAIFGLPSNDDVVNEIPRLSFCLVWKNVRGNRMHGCCSDVGLTFAFQFLYGCQYTVSTQLINPFVLCMPYLSTQSKTR